MTTEKVQREHALKQVELESPEALFFFYFNATILHI